MSDRPECSQPAFEKIVRAGIESRVLEKKKEYCEGLGDKNFFR